MAYLSKHLGGKDLCVREVIINDNGIYHRGLTTIRSLPPYVSVTLDHRTGCHTETITIWSPLARNDRFMGTGDGGTGTRGVGYITKPDNTSRGHALPKAVLNDFTAATTDAGNPKMIGRWIPTPTRWIGSALKTGAPGAHTL